MIVLQGAGRAFCAGYDLKAYAEGGAGTQGSSGGSVGPDQGLPRS